MEYKIDSETIEAENDWECECYADEIDQVPALKALVIDRNLCDIVTIVKSEDGRFFAAWRERHPEMVNEEEFFGRTLKRTANQIKKWDELRRRMPSKHYIEEISREDAYAIVRFFWLPKEFHADAGF